MRDRIFKFIKYKITWKGGENVKTSLHRLEAIFHIEVEKEGNILLEKIENISASITFGYDSNNFILKELPLELCRGKIYCVVGKNGEGKSTLTKILIGILHAKSILVNGINIDCLNMEELRKNSILYISQALNYPNRTIKEIYQEYNSNIRLEDVIRKIKEHDLNEEQLIPLYQENWNKNINTLSGGEKQIVSILKCLVKEADMIIFDEPTSNLDIKRINALLRLIERLKMEKKILLIVSHDSEIIQASDINYRYSVTANLKIFISCMAIYLTGTYDNLTGNVLCLAIILLVLLTNILTFAIFHKLSIVIADNYKNELLLQEVKMKEQYYREIEAGNKKVQEIKHDLKNRLIALYAIEKANVDFKKEFQKIIGELDEGEKTIYTANIIVNTILNNKLRNAQKRHIATEASVLVPKQMNLDYSAAGILLGNLLDNAIEACEKIEASKRWIAVNIIYKEHTLILKICNSKEIKKANIALSSKRHYKQSGIGIHSVTRVVEKYNGTIEFLDLGDSFEVSAVLYGILSEVEL